MLETINVNGRFAPYIRCDVCGEHIKEPGMALAVFTENPDEGKPVQTLHVHKGKCDNIASEKVGDAGGTTELDVYLVYLLHNVGMTDEGFARAKRVAGMLEQIG